MKEEAENLLKNAAGYSIGLAVIMIILGCAAIVMPMFTGVAVSVMFGWIVLVGGFIYFGYAFTAQGVGGFLWRMLIGVLYVIGGSYLLLNTAVTLEALTFALACVFVIEGLLEIIAFFALQGMPGAGWVLFDAIVAIALGLMIGYSLPSSSTWALGTLVGVNLLMSGFTRLFYSTAVKSAVSAAA